MKRYLTEFIGTFFLVLTIGLAVLAGEKMAPLAIGAALMVMVYMGGHISGAHYNPAVSLAVLLRGRLEAKDFVPYVLSQVAGGLMAALAVNAILAHPELDKTTFAPEPGSRVGIQGALLVESLYTFALALVVLNTATAKKTEGNSYYGLAIGFTVTAAAFAGGPVSGGAFNPAVGIGLTVVHALLGGGTWQHLWIYIVGPCAGAIVAALLFRIQEEGV